jgi:hypothetical protein
MILDELQGKETARHKGGREGKSGHDDVELIISVDDHLVINLANNTCGQEEGIRYRN